MPGYLVVALLAWAFLPATPASPTNLGVPGVWQLQYTTTTGSAFFSYVDGCIHTNMSVFFSEEVFHSPPAVKDKQTSISLGYLDRRDSCTSTLLLSFVPSTPTAVEFEVAGDLASASLNATIPGTDRVSGGALAVTVDVTWTGDRSIDRDHEQLNHTDEQTGARTISIRDDARREAVASGSLRLDGASFVLGQSHTADLFTASQWSMTID